MPTKTWKKFDDACDHCGDDDIVFYTRLDNNTAGQGWAYDGDILYCRTCGAKGMWHVIEEGGAYSNWNEENWTNDSTH